MVVLGIDPGARRTGYAVIEAAGEKVLLVAAGVLSTSSKSPFAERLRSIYQGLSKVVSKFRPDQIAIEDVFVKNNVRVALRMGHVRGVALLVGANQHIPIGEYSPGEIKQAIVGSGSASKEQIRFMVTALLNLPEVPAEDEADALAVAICHIHRCRLGKESPLDILCKRYSC
jgi:crossover junction endodeoxyribonuclease RuvC